MQVLWNSGTFHQGVPNGGRIPEEREGDSQRSRPSNFLPNGVFIPRHYQGATFRDGFNNFYNQNPALLQVAQASRAPKVTMNFVSVGVEPVEEEEDKDAVVEAELLHMLATVAQNRAKKQGKFNGVVVGKPASQKGLQGFQ